MMMRGDVRHDPEREDRELGERTAREQVEERDGPRVAGGLLQVDDRLVVHPRHGDVRADAVHDQHRQSEKDLVAQIRDGEDVLQARQPRHARSS
jgi:hypothetical protein